ncbi:hypothetical protein ACS5PN_13520 [Roseateles sp. NT4]|uniref:hypothetical protein n=1 Tax=Roseateles sp. NT4 TaxID=3453715 RepID=UPI003EEE7338
MLTFLFRCLLFCFGLVLVVDAGLPMRMHQLHVDRHTSSTSNDTRSSGRSDTSYTLHFVGGALSSCDVGYATYTTLKDGDSVEVKATKLFKRCVQIERDGETFEYSKYWRLFQLVGGALLILSAVGLLGRDDDDDRSGFSIRPSW